MIFVVDLEGLITYPTHTNVVTKCIKIDTLSLIAWKSYGIAKMEFSWYIRCIVSFNLKHLSVDQHGYISNIQWDEIVPTSLRINKVLMTFSPLKEVTPPPLINCNEAHLCQFVYSVDLSTFNLCLKL